MAVNVITVKCPQCGGAIEKGQKFCSYCGTQIFVKDDDEVDLKKISYEAMLELKRLEMAEKEAEASRKSTINILIMMFVVGVALIALAAVFSILDA